MVAPPGAAPTPMPYMTGKGGLQGIVFGVVNGPLLMAKIADKCVVIIILPELTAAPEQGICPARRLAFPTADHPA